MSKLHNYRRSRSVAHWTHEGDDDSLRQQVVSGGVAEQTYATTVDGTTGVVSQVVNGAVVTTLEDDGTFQIVNTDGEAKLEIVGQAGTNKLIDFYDGATRHGRVYYGTGGDFNIQNSEDNNDIILSTKGATSNARIVQQTTNEDADFRVEGNGTGDGVVRFYSAGSQVGSLGSDAANSALVQTVGTTTITHKDADIEMKNTSAGVVLDLDGNTADTVVLFKDDGTTEASIRWDRSAGQFKHSTSMDNDDIVLETSGGRTRVTNSKAGSDTTFSIYGDSGANALQEFRYGGALKTRLRGNSSGEFIIRQYQSGAPVIFTSNAAAENINVELRKPTSANAFLGINMAPGTHNINVTGTAGLSSGTAWTNTSDQRIKENIVPYDSGRAAEILKAISIRQFDFKPEYAKQRELRGKYAKQRLGVIAQELERVYPHAVNSPEDDWKNVDVTDFTYLLISGFQHLAARVERLEHLLSKK